MNQRNLYFKENMFLKIQENYILSDKHYIKNNNLFIHFTYKKVKKYEKYKKYAI